MLLEKHLIPPSSSSSSHQDGGRVKTSIISESPTATVDSFDEPSSADVGRSTTVSQQQQHVAVAANTTPQGDVWYRRFLQLVLFIRKNHPSYRQVFRNRVVQRRGIPAGQLRGLHPYFEPSYKHYSPLIALIFAHNNYIDNTFCYGNNDQAVVTRLVRLLFHVLPGGEIQPTHAERNAAAHLTPGLVGAILEVWESFRHCHQHNTTTGQDHHELCKRLERVLVQHPDHEQSRKDVLEQVQVAQEALRDVLQKDEASQTVRARIKQLEGDVIKFHKHKIKRLEKDLLSQDITKRLDLEHDIQEAEQVIIKAEEQVTQLRKSIVTSLDKKLARKALKRAQDAAELEAKSVGVLADALAQALCTTEYTMWTTSILQAYLWRKYDDIRAMIPYLEAMDRIGALNSSLDVIVSHIKTNMETSVAASPLAHQRMSPAQLETAVTIITGDTGGNLDRPPIIPFSYITWAAYSEFPDCGETALRNLMNQLVYNTESGLFDVDLLVKLRRIYYPRMSSRLIDFYHRHSNVHEETTDHRAALDWIEVVSGLNRARDPISSTRIRYRRIEEEKNIASPLRNLLRVFNALFGVDDLDSVEKTVEIGDRINELRQGDDGVCLNVSGLKSDGFGILGVQVGQVQYELQSYRPVHFGFVQVESGGARRHKKKERSQYREFRKALSLDTRRRHGVDFDQLAVASLLVPYHLRRGHIGKYFSSDPALGLMFADFSKSIDKKLALGWAHSRERSNDELSSLVDRIESYVAPSFAPH